MKMLNPTAGLTCSMQDHQLSELKKRNAARLPEKLLLANKIGIFGSLDPIAISLVMEFLSTQMRVHMCGYPIFTLDLELHYITVHATLCSKALPSLITTLKDVMQHNFIPSLLALGACAIALHYNTVMKNYMNCPIPVICGLVRPQL